MTHYTLGVTLPADLVSLRGKGCLLCSLPFSSVVFVLRLNGDLVSLFLSQGGASDWSQVISRKVLRLHPVVATQLRIQDELGWVQFWTPCRSGAGWSNYGFTDEVL